MNHYIKRFLSKTPKALKKLQAFFAVLATASGAALALMTQYKIDGSLFDVLTYIAVCTAFAVPVLQFATSDPKLVNKNDK